MTTATETWTPDQSTRETAQDPNWINHWRNLALPRCQRADGERNQEVVSARVTVLLADEVLRLREVVELALSMQHPDALRYVIAESIDLELLAPDERVAMFAPFGWAIYREASA